MAIENKDRPTRGGCLDKAVSILTLGVLGVETTIKSGYKDPRTGEVFNDDPVKRVHQTGREVGAEDWVNYYTKHNHISRRLVKNTNL